MKKLFIIIDEKDSFIPTKFKFIFKRNTIKGRIMKIREFKIPNLKFKIFTLLLM